MRLTQSATVTVATFLQFLTVASTLETPSSPKQAITELQIDILESRVCTRKTQRGDRISVHYNGTLLDGSMFDSSYSRNDPFTFTVGRGQVIQGWDQGLLDMCVGEVRKLTIPPGMAYGARAMAGIPANSVLVFGTKLMAIQGVAEEPQPEPIQTVEPSVMTVVEENLIKSSASSYISMSTTSTETKTATLTSTTASEATLDSQKKPPPSEDDEDGPNGPGAENGECRLLGPFALLVQAGLGALALLSLVFKRWRERPRRPLKVWFFDASKQVFGSVLLHVLNLLMSMFSSGDFELATQARVGTAQLIAAAGGDPKAPTPNPCSFYLVNLAIDTTIGIPILVLLLKVLHALFSRTPIARPAGSLRSGNYGSPPHATWWLKQAMIYFLALFLMKLCVFFIFQLLPWIAWVGDWALRWTEGNEALQIAFVMFVFPLIMNAAQYYIIDGFIKDGGSAGQAAGSGEGGESRYERVADDLEDGEEEVGGGERYGDDSASSGSEAMDKSSRKRSVIASTKEVEDAAADAKLLLDREEEDEGGRKGKGVVR